MALNLCSSSKFYVENLQWCTATSISCMTLEPSYLLIFVNCYIILYMYNRLHLLPQQHLYNMWIESWIHFMARQPYTSLLRYISPASGNSTPDLGLQDDLGMNLNDRSMPPTLHSNMLTNSSTCFVCSWTLQEDLNNTMVSQWWGTADFIKMKSLKFYYRNLSTHDYP